MRLPVIIAAAFAVVTLSGCGQAGQLRRAAEAPGPAVPTGETKPPTVEQQTTPDVQARPRRSDEVLRQSQEREADEFDLPPS